MPFSPRIESFINAVVEGVTIERAFRDNFDCSRFLDHTIKRKAQELRNSPEILKEIEQRLEAARANSIRTVQDVTNEFLRIAFADPGDIIQHRRLCCRYCHGVNHQYQWKDAAEFNTAVTDTEAQNIARKRMRPPLPALAIPSDAGGFGFAFNAPPSPSCPECRGEGQPDLFIADTTKLTADQRRLIERVKIAKDGSMEIRFRNQSDALTKAGQMLGGFKQTVVLQNPDGSAVNAPPVVTPLTPEQAQEQYMKWMNGNGDKV